MCWTSRTWALTWSIRGRTHERLARILVVPDRRAETWFNDAAYGPANPTVAKAVSTLEIAVRCQTPPLPDRVLNKSAFSLMTDPVSPTVCRLIQTILFNKYSELDDCRPNCLNLFRAPMGGAWRAGYGPPPSPSFQRDRRACRGAVWMAGSSPAMTGWWRRWRSMESRVRPCRKPKPDSNGSSPGIHWRRHPSRPAAMRAEAPNGWPDRVRP